MAKLIDMRTESEGHGAEPYTPPRYPGGLRLYLSEDQCEALGLTKALRAGTALAVNARAIVTSSTESLERDGDDKGPDISLSMQITDLAVTPQGVERNAAARLYG